VISSQRKINRIAPHGSTPTQLEKQEQVAAAAQKPRHWTGQWEVEEVGLGTVIAGSRAIKNAVSNATNQNHGE